jgi:hypothetical protein
MIKVKHPKDMNQLAKHIVDLATGNAEKDKEVAPKTSKKTPKSPKGKK